MVLIADQISGTVDSIRIQLHSAIHQMSAYVEQVERTPGKVSTNCSNIITTLSVTCQDLTVKLDRYSLFLPNLSDIIVETDETVEALADRYLKRSKQEGLPMSTTDAMNHFNRSRSTIYRWIKSGKIHAEKHGYRWTIFI
jgi:hypothetical protein